MFRQRSNFSNRHFYIPCIEVRRLCQVLLFLSDSVRLSSGNGVETRNETRFPEDFMFRLTIEEHESLRCQNGTSNEGRGGRRYLPLVFTEGGVAMLSSFLTSEQVALVNISIIRTFIKLEYTVTPISLQ